MTIKKIVGYPIRLDKVRLNNFNVICITFLTCISFSKMVT